MHVHVFGNLSILVCPTLQPICDTSAPFVDRGPVPEHPRDRRRHLGGSSPPPADCFPSGWKPRWSQHYQGGTLPTSSPACNHNIRTLKFLHRTFLPSLVILLVSPYKMHNKSFEFYKSLCVTTLDQRGHRVL